MSKVSRKEGHWPPSQPCTKCGAEHVLTWPCPSGVVAANKRKAREEQRLAQLAVDQQAIVDYATVVCNTVTTNQQGGFR